MMSLLDRVRASVSRPDGGSPASRDAGGMPRWWRLVAPGVSAAGATWLTLALLALVVWVATPMSTAGFPDALVVASALWFVGTGTPVVVGGSVYGLVPLGFWALAVWLAARGAEKTLGELDDDGLRWSAVPTRQAAAGFVGGYAAVALAAGLICLAGSARPSFWAILTVPLVPALGIALAVARRCRRGDAPAELGPLLDRVPLWVRRGIAPGLLAAGVTLGCGLAVTLAVLAARIPEVVGLYGSIAPGIVGGIAVTLGQLLLLPNLAVWAVAWLAGPGFDVTAGSSITLSGAEPGLVPMLPVVGALPTEGQYPQWLLLALLLPVAIGALAAWRTCSRVARLSSWRTKLRSSLVAAAVATGVLAVVTFLSAGPAGDDRLRHIGPNPLLVVPALAAELAVGAALYVLVVQLWDRVARRIR